MSASVSLPNVFVRRLALVRYWYTLAVRQSRLPEPMRGMSLLMFHDTLELFFEAAATRRNVTAKSGHRKFAEYIASLNATIAPEELPDRAAVSRLNKGRNSLKHDGTMPSALDLESYRATTTSFLKASTPLLFELDFDAISLSDLVTSEKARGLLREAEALLETHGALEALLRVGMAFEALVAEFDARRVDEWGPDPFMFGEPIGRLKGIWTLNDRRGQDDVLDRFVDTVTGTVEQVQRGLRLMTMGVDMRRYFRVLEIELRARIQAQDVRPPAGHRHGRPVAAEHFQYCRDFVVETALVLQQFEAELEVSP